MPVFSPLVDAGSVVFQHPALGPLDFDVDLEGTGRDELGRVNVGTAHFINEETGYEIHIEFAEDGTKAGDVRGSMSMKPSVRLNRVHTGY